MLFGKKKEEFDGLLYAPANGKMIPIENVPDKVFAEKMIGDGGAVILEEGIIVSPVSGTVATVADTLHAYGIQTANGLEVLVHVGIDTVKLNGKGFQCKVKTGQKVKKGDILCLVDLEVLKENGCELYTPVLIANMDMVQSISVHEGNAEAGKTVMLECKQ